MILILGKSTLAYALEKELANVKIIGKPEYDFSNQIDCDLVLDRYNPDVIINTFALNQTNNTWNILSTNFVATAYLTHKFYEKLDGKHIINISSASSNWVSFPGIDSGRFFYSLSKECVSNFGKHYNRKINETRKNTVSTIEIPKFASKFNNFSKGIELDRVVKTVSSCITNQFTHLTLLDYCD